MSRVLHASLRAAFVLCAVALPTVAQAQATISIGGSNSIAPFGKPNTQTYGQTFQTPDATNTVLDQFTFYMEANPTGLLQGYVFAWDAADGHATGSALFTSAVTAEPSSGSGFLPVTMVTPGVALTAGQEYVAFLSTTGDAGSGQTDWAWGGSYSDGSWVWYNNGEDFGALTTQTWDNSGPVGSGANMKFDASFETASPEPATVGLLATGLIGIAGVARRKRANKA